MLVYRNSRRPRQTRDLLRTFRENAERLCAGSSGHGEIRDLLVAFDELESGIVDALHPDADNEGEVEKALRQTALALGSAFVASHDGRCGEARTRLRRVCARAAEAENLDLPSTILTDEAEGYAWYALYPETYIAAARRFVREMRPSRVVCLGIRQIGASLSAVVAATLRERGCSVSLHTVRPRGHPFGRTFFPSPPFEECLRSRRDEYFFLLVDEGPGLSGTSFCGVAETLSGWGVPDDRIVFFPSWRPDPGKFVSPVARERWPRHTLFCADWSETWSGGSPLAHAFPRRGLVDMSGGLWRPRLLGNPSRFPAVHPQHERRRFLLPPEAAPQDPLLARFAGFGRRGKAALERGRALEEAGWGPPVMGETEGFLLTPFIDGRPLQPGRTPPFVALKIAEYLAWVRERYPVEEETSPETLTEMIRTNVAEEFGTGGGKSLDLLLSSHVVGAPPTALDARLFPHRWLVTDDGVLKTGAMDHHDDHFYPGATDIAWDVAGTSIEFQLCPSEAALLLQRYAEVSGDTSIRRRVPFYRLAYLAFRLGYTRHCARDLGSSEEGRRFAREAERYAMLLRAEIG